MEFLHTLRVRNRLLAAYSAVIFVIFLSLVVFFDIQKNVNLLWITIILGFFVCFLVVLWLLYLSFTKKVSVIIAGLEKISRGDFSIRFENLGKDDFGIVADNLNEAVIHIETIDRENKEFISHAAHQIRTPLAVLRWNLETIDSGDVGEVTKEQSHWIKKAYTGALSLVDIVNKLLVVDHILTNRVSVQWENVDIFQGLAEVIQEREPFLKERKQSVEVSEANPILIASDPSMLREIFIQLITNASKFSPEGSQIHIQAIVNESSVSIQVSDEGMGVPEDERSKLFEKFFQGQNAKKSNPDGTGIGLFIVKNFVEKLNGQISFAPREGKGSVFSFTLPLASSPVVAS